MAYGDHSFLEIPITLLRKMIPFINKYYGGTSRHLDAYEHVFTGVIATLFTAVLMQIDLWFWTALIPAFTFHVIIKEVIVDKKKRTTPAEWRAFKADMITRIAGFVFGAPILLVPILCR